MDKLKEGVKPGYFLVISYWAGYSRKPGSTGIFLYPDGNFIIKDSRTNLADRDRKEVVVTKEGELSNEELLHVQKYIADNVTKNSTKNIYDAGHCVEVIRNGITFRVENDDEIYKSLSELLHFREKVLSLQQA